MGVNNQRCTGPGMGGQARRPRSSCGQPCLRPHSPYAYSPMPGELWRGRDNDGRLPGSKICRLTTFLFGVSDRTDFHVQTFFSLQNRQRGNLCGMHKFLRCIIVYHRMSQSSDARCRGFESPRPQRAVLFGRCSFLFESPNYHHNVVLYWKKRYFAFEKIRSGPHQKAHSTRVYSGRRRGFMVYWWQLTERSNRRTRLWRT